MSCNCEFKRYHSFNYLPGDKDKSHPFVEAPYCVNIFDVMGCSRGVELGVFTCVLTMERKICDAEHKESCCHYKNYLERLKRPKIPTMWNDGNLRLWTVTYRNLQSLLCKQRHWKKQERYRRLYLRRCQLSSWHSVH